MMSRTRVVAFLNLLTLLTCFVIPTDAAEQNVALLKTDIEFAQVGELSLTLDAYVPDGDGPTTQRPEVTSVFDQEGLVPSLE